MPTVNHLRQLGHDVLTLQDLNMAAQAVSDDKVLAKAVTLDRYLLTLNRKDFIKLHQQNNGHTGILITTFDTNFIALALRIHACLLANQQPFGQLLRVQRPNLR